MIILGASDARGMGTLVDVSASCAIQAQASRPGRRSTQGSKEDPDLTRSSPPRTRGTLSVLPRHAFSRRNRGGGPQEAQAKEGPRGPRSAAVAAPREKDLGDQRVVINVFYVQLGSPSKDDGAGRHATIGQIRVRMGDETPEACTVQRKLKAPA